MEKKQSSNNFLSHFKLFRKQKGKRVNTIQKANSMKTFQQSPMTLFFIHPNILFPHPRNKNQHLLMNRTQQGFKRPTKKRKQAISTSYTVNRKCKTALCEHRQNKGKYEKRLNQYIKMEKIYNQFRKNGRFLK